MSESIIQYSMVPLLQAAEVRSLEGNPSAIPAYNVNIFAQGEGIGRGLAATDSPGIIQLSGGARKFNGGTKNILKMIYSSMPEGVIYTVHLDHGKKEEALDCLAKGQGSVMIDASALEFNANIASTKEIVDVAHKQGSSVEGEYGLLAGVEDETEHEKSTYADPKFVPVFFKGSGADALAIAYGTSHGPTKGRTDLLNLQIPKESYALLKKEGMNEYHFLVSHGSSTVPEEFVAVINQYGGNLAGTSGVPEDMLIQAIGMGMRKINIDTDLRLAMTGQVRKWLIENKDVAKESELVRYISAMFDGSIPAIDVKKKTVVPADQMVDPRLWLQEINRQAPESLREDYRKTGDGRFIDLMAIISDTVADHVEYLNGVFGSAGLATSVDTSMNLEEMARNYTRDESYGRSSEMELK